MATPQQEKGYTFVIVPGSFATPSSYSKLETHMRSQGHTIKVLSLISANDGTRMPPATMEDDAAHIRAAIIVTLDDETKPSNVVLMMHSYGGVPGSSALRGLGKTDRLAQGKGTAVIGIMYLAAFMLAAGRSNRQIMVDFNAMPEATAKGVPGGYMPAIDPAFASFIFNDLESAEERAENLATFTRHSSDSFDGKVSYEAWKYIPSVQIIPGNDLAVPTFIQEAMYEDARAAGGKVTRVFLEGAGHVPSTSRPEFVAAELVKLAEGQS